MKMPSRASSFDRLGRDGGMKGSCKSDDENRRAALAAKNNLFFLSLEKEMGDRGRSRKTEGGDEAVEHLKF